MLRYRNGLTRLAVAAVAATGMLAANLAPARALTAPVPTPVPPPLTEPISPPPVLSGGAPSAPGVAVPGVSSSSASGALPALPGTSSAQGGTTSAGGGAADPSSPGQAPPAYPGPPPEERQALPDEPGRVDLEEQQFDLAALTDALDREFAESALLAHGSDGKFVWPIVFKSHPPMTQPFGCTTLAGEPFNGACASKRWHTGIDLGVPKGTPIFAAADGIVHVFRSDKGYGNYLLVNNGDGFSTLYGHLSDFAVRDHEVVRQGELIGYAGSTGFSTGPHLHFEVRHEADFLDPCAFLKCARN